MHEPISPELALVDPELARRARSRLPDVYTYASFGAASGAAAAVAPTREPARKVVGPFPSRRFGTEPHHAPADAPRALRYVAAAVLLALLLAALGGETYLWTASVRAGGTPPSLTASPTSPPEAGSPTTPARTFTWVPEPGAAAYRFSLFRGSTLILVATTREPRLALPPRWRFEGGWYGLVPGAYVWNVRPLRATGSDTRPGPPIVQATYSVAG